MASILRNRSYLRLFVGAIVVLTGLVFLNLRMVRYGVPASELAGTYQRAPVAFLKVAHLPEKVVLGDDGTMTLKSAEGVAVFTGVWEWDEQEGVARVNDHRWDRQIRLRSTLTGPRLCMRVSEFFLAEDYPEHDEEVDLVRVDVSNHTSGD